MSRPLLLDLFCGAGGAAMGYHRAGFDVVGVDIEPQPRYPIGMFYFTGDALDVLRTGWVGDPTQDGPRWRVSDFAAIHASPPCQAYTNAQKIRGRDHPALIAPLRELLDATGLPWVIENVPGAPLRAPVRLCGRSFGLPLYRHRFFEANWPVEPMEHLDHDLPIAKMGRPPKVGEAMHVVGNFSGVAQARKAMGIDWMNRGELSEAIPPAYTEWIGRQLLASLEKAA